MENQDNNTMLQPRLHPATRNLFGKTIGNLDVIGFAGYKKRGKRGSCAYWLCKCTCGRQIEIRSDGLLRETSVKISCPSCSKAYFDRSRGTFLRILAGYKEGAKLRNLEWNLSEACARELLSSNCYYCDSPPGQIRKSRGQTLDFIYNGIDRVDNSIGYVVDNVVSCCKRCNWIKSDLSLDRVEKLCLRWRAFIESRDKR